MGCDGEITASKTKVDVSIHAPAWGATFKEPMINAYQTFQSTHPHGVRRVHVTHIRNAFGVSIHAPAWGATVDDLYNGTLVFSFNPRTRMGCDPRRCRTGKPSQRFNPRTRMGCDYAVL